VDPAGERISLAVQDNAGHSAGTTNLLVPGVMVSNQWHQIAVVFRYEFLLLMLGSNYLGETEGYVPAMFAHTNFDRHFTLWTNSLPYSIINGKTLPAFGGKQKRTGCPSF